MMGHDKLRKFAQNETFACLLQPNGRELLADGYANLRDHSIKGCWREQMFPNSLAGSEGGLVLELGCGKGEYTIGLAERNPSRNYVGVDIKGARLWKGAKYAHQHQLPNVAFLRTRIEFIHAFFTENEVSELWLTFSDPQFRSENSRLSSPIFLERYSKFLRHDGIIHLKTDSQFLYQYTLAVCKVNGLEVLASSENLYASDLNQSGIPVEVKEIKTFYEGIFLEQGYPIFYLAFRINGKTNFVSPLDPQDFDSRYWRSVEGPRKLFGSDTAETRRQKMKSIG